MANYDALHTYCMTNDHVVVLTEDGVDGVHGDLIENTDLYNLSSK